MAQCTCGFTKFSESRSSSEADVACWVLYGSTVLGGAGSSPVGSPVGAGDEPEEEDALWAKILVPVSSTTLLTSCASCGRRRTSKSLGGLGVAGIDPQNGNLYLTTLPLANLGCYSVEFRGATTYSYALRRAEGAPPAMNAEDVLQLSLDPPAGEPRATTLLYVPLPADVNDPGIYSIYVVDSCAQTERALGTVYLENEPMLIPLQTVEHDMPERMFLQGRAGEPASPTSLQLMSFNPYTIPFDKCDGVLEYDPRLGTTPTAQGWTESNPGLGSYTVVNGVLRHVQSAGAASTFAKASTMPTTPTQIHFYFNFLCDYLDQPTAAKAVGVYGDGVNIRYLPVEGTIESAGPTLFTPNKLTPDASLCATGKYGWARAGAFYSDTVLLMMIGDVTLGGSATPGTVPFPGVFSLQMGNDSLLCTGGSTYYRYACASSPGRFLRAYFRAASSVASPVLRLYVMAESYTGSSSARFKVRYDSGTVSPAGRPSQEVSVTSFLSTAGAVYELAVTLTGVGAGPVWFSVEREWDHADDALRSTAHLVQLTLRST